MMKIEASHIHKQHISVTLMLLERTVDSVPCAALLIAYSDSVPDTMRGEALALAAEARHEIEIMVAELDLPQHEESIIRSLLGKLHVRVVNVVELQPQRLRSGGEVPRALAEYIGAKADRLESLLRRLIALLERAGSQR
ncbi:MAG TPA: hypothetical protein VNN73_23115 [Blastocatellia bacterium]|nr:hypothetical protein [Blastocatellia bacterium]